MFKSISVSIPLSLSPLLIDKGRPEVISVPIWNDSPVYVVLITS